MKLCHIVPSLEEQHGGPSKSVRALCAALARGSDEVELLTTAPDAPATGTIDLDRASGLRIQTYRRDWPRQVCPSAGLSRAVAESDAAIVHHHALWLRTLHYAHQRARRGPPLVISPRGMMSTWAWQHHATRKALSRWLVHPGAFEAAAGWHATSDEEEREIRALGFKQPICVAPNGVNVPTVTETAAARDHWRAACPAVANRPVALFYSRFHRKKRVIELIDLWLEHGPRDWLLLLVGIAQDYTAETLDRYVTKMGGGGRVTAFSGEGLPPPYPVASLFVLPSHNENFGLVIAEAMAHDVPVLVTDTTPWQGVNRAEVGWCVPWENYAATLRQATAEGTDRLRERGQRARDWVRNEFSWDRWATRLREFYAALPGGPG